MPGESTTPGEVRVAVQRDGQFPHLFILDQTRPLTDIVQDLCIHWHLRDPPQDYALRFDCTPTSKSEKTPGEVSSGKPSDDKTSTPAAAAEAAATAAKKEPVKATMGDFITERNRIEIKNGTVMWLTSSPSRTVQLIMERLGGGGRNNMEKTSALREVSELSFDVTFAQELISRNGLQWIISAIENSTCSGDDLAYCLKSFVELMDHSIVSWDILEPKFIKVVSNCVMSHKILDVTTLQSALEILENVVLHSSDAVFEQEITIDSLVPHLQSANAEVQKNTVALINALFYKASADKKHKMAEILQSKNVRGIILQNIIHKSPSQNMAHQLHVLQRSLFSLLNEYRHTPVDTSDQTALSKVYELRRIAFDLDPDSKPSIDKRGSQAQDFKKLGFQNHDSPLDDFLTTPPGVLALDNMHYFAMAFRDNYTKVVLENSCRTDDHDLPFARASIELVNVLCEILKVGEQPSDDEVTYYPMFFTHDRGFEEFYCICIQLLNKTWKEMKASSIDFNKVFAVLREQVTRALQHQIMSFDQLRSRLSHLPFSEITSIWQKERKNKVDNELSSPPIQELKKKIAPDIIDLIRRQRMNHLVNGMRFTMKLSRRSDKFIYCRLSPNHKMLHYGECDENAVPSIDQLPNKLAVVDIKDLLTGKDCPHVKDKSKGAKGTQNPNLAFSIVPAENLSLEPVNFVAATEDIFYIWTDAVNALLGRQMSSPLLAKDLDTLLSMEIKLRLLDIEGITIPTSPPPIPPEPPNYDFVCRK